VNVIGRAEHFADLADSLGIAEAMSCDDHEIAGPSLACALSCLRHLHHSSGSNQPELAACTGRGHPGNH
jgi:hypothetical protein